MFRWNRWVIFLAAWFLFVGTADAHAFFLVPLFTAIGSVLAWLGPIGQAILGIAIKVGLSLIEKAKQKQVQEPGVQIQIETGGDNPLSFIMGPFADAGQLEYVNTWGHADKTPNAYVTDVISLGDLPLHQIIGCFVDDTRITIPTMTGSPPTVQGWPVAEYAEDGHDYLWMNWHDGRQTTVDTFLLGKFSTDPDRPWTSAMVGFGVPYVTMTARVNQRLFPGGRPKYLFETDGIALYDIRKDSTAGGSGSHRWTDQTTWEVSDNNIVQAYNIIRGIHYGTEWVYGGQTTQGYQLPAANWMAAMNACDTLISLVGGGTEKQYRSGCRVAVDQEPAGVVESILKGASGRIAEVGGMYKVTVGAPGAAIYSFTDASVVVSEGQTFDPFPGLEQTFNGAQASYPEPLEKWASKDAPAYYRADLEVLDDNRRLVTGLTFPTVPYAVQIQRLLKEAIDDSRRFRQHMFYLPPEAWLLEPGDIVAWTSAHNSYTDKKFIVISIEGGSNFLQLVMLKEVDPADFVWNPLTDQHAYSIGFLGQIVPAPQPMSGWQVFPANLVDSTGNARRPSMEVRFDGDLDDVQYARIQTRLASTMELVFDSPCPYGDPTTNSNPMSVILNGSFLPLTNYEVRGRFLPYSTRPTEWSAWLPVTTDDTRFAALDIGDHVISITHFASGITPVELFATTPSNADPANFEGRQVFNTTDGLLYTFKSGAWTLTVSSNILAGSITNAQIANAAIDASKLATGAVTALKIAAAAVTSTAIATGAVLTAALAANAVTVAAIADDAVTNAKIINGAIDAAKLAAGAVTLTKFASGITPVEILGTLPVTGNFDGRLVFLTTDKKLYRYNGTAAAFQASVATVDLTGQITTAQVAANAITTALIAANAITAAQIATGAVGATQIAALAVTNAAIAANAVQTGNILTDAITAALIATGAVGSSELAAGAVIAGKITAGTIVAGDIAAATITGAKIAAGTVTATNILAGTISATEIGAGAITAVKLAAGAVIAGKITAGTIVSGDIAAGTIVAGNIAALTITASLIAAGTITTTQIAASTIVAGNIAANTITASQIAADTITAGQIAAGAITASEIAANAVTATAIAAGTITSDKMVAGSITARELILTNFENILPDNQMQSSTSWGLSTGWTLNPTGGGGLISTGAITYSVASGLDINSLQSQMFPLDAGATYYMYANCFSGAAFRPLVVLATYDGSGSFLGFTSLSNSGVTTGGSAVTIHELNYLVPSGTKLGALIFRQQIGTSNMVVGSGLVRKKADANLIVNGAITTLKLAAGSVTAAAIAAGTITATEIATGTITAGNIASGAITTVKIQAGAVVAASIAAGTITSDKMVAGSITARELILTNFDNIIPDNQMQSAAAWSLATGWSILPTSGGGLKSVGAASYNVASGLGTNGLQSQLFPLDAGYTYYGYVNVFSSATWTATVALATYDGSAAFLGFTAFSNSSVSQSAGVSAYEVHFAVPSGTKYGALIVRQDAGTANILAGSVLMKKKADANLIVDGSITTSKLLANAVTAAKIAANTITAGQIAAGAISATELAAGAITAGKIAAGAISTSTLFVNGVIVTGNMANNAVIDSAAKVTLAPTVLTVNAGFVDMLTINIPLRDNTNAVELTFFLSATTTGGPSGSASAQARVVRRISGVDTIIAETQWPGGGAGAGSTLTYTALPASYSDDAAPAAAYSYKLQYSGTASGGGSAVNVSGTMVAKWWKR